MNPARHMYHEITLLSDLVNAKCKLRLQYFEESSPRSDLAGGWCCFGKKVEGVKREEERPA